MVVSILIVSLYQLSGISISALGRLKQENWKFKVNWGYIGKSYLKKKKTQRICCMKKIEYYSSLYQVILFLWKSPLYWIEISWVLSIMKVCVLECFILCVCIWACVYMHTYIYMDIYMSLKRGKGGRTKSQIYRSVHIYIENLLWLQI